LFDQRLFTTTPTTEDCELDNGSSTQCYKISFRNYQNSTGPFCPATLWDAMEADGFDIVDDEGNVRFNLGQAGSSCLDMEVQDLTITFLIPAVPEMLDAPNTIDMIELYGVSAYDGMPITGPVPSVVDGPPIPGASGGGIPSLDPCGGHGDPAGYWHWHFEPQNMQSVLAGYGITDATCTDVAQKTEGLLGFAKDGYPIYSALEDGAVPDGLDGCNGKFGATDDFPDGIYHYYALNQAAPNLPSCIMGASVRTPLSYE
jgi:hypothetical protein